MRIVQDAEWTVESASPCWREEKVLCLRIQNIIDSTWIDNKVRELELSGLVNYEFVRTGQTVSQVYYLEVLKRLREKVRRKRPELLANNSWILHYDNAPALTALSVREFLATKQMCWNTLPIHRIYPPMTFSVPEDKGNIERKAF